MPMSRKEIEAIIVNGERLIREAEEALAQSQRFFADNNIDPQACAEFMRKHANDPMVVQIQAEMEELMRRVDADVERRQLEALSQSLSSSGVESQSLSQSGSQVLAGTAPRRKRFRPDMV